MEENKIYEVANEEDCGNGGGIGKVLVGVGIAGLCALAYKFGKSIYDKHRANKLSQMPAEQLEEIITPEEDSSES